MELWTYSERVFVLRRFAVWIEPFYVAAMGRKKIFLAIPRPPKPRILQRQQLAPGRQRW